MSPVEQIVSNISATLCTSCSPLPPHSSLSPSLSFQIMSRNSYPTPSRHRPISIHKPRTRQENSTNLIFRMTLKKQHIHHPNLVHISMPLKLLPHLRPQRRNRNIERIHRLDFRCLFDTSSALLSHSHTIPPRIFPD
jgi:hypothetical protein